MPSMAGELLSETFDYDGGRKVTVYVPPAPPEAIVFAGDGQLISQWGVDLESTAGPPTMIVGVHRLDDENLRLQEYVCNTDFDWADPQRFAAHETFFVEDVRQWVGSHFGVTFPAERVMPSPLPRAYLVAGTRELFFRKNARRWAKALRDAGAEVAMTERNGSHGDAFWRQEFPLMVAWAFGQ